MINFPNFIQNESKDCGPTCIFIIAQYYGKPFLTESVLKICSPNKRGVTILKLSNAAKYLGFSTVAAKISIDNLNEIQLPCIVLLHKNHYAVIYKVTKYKVYISDPAFGLFVYSKNEFIKNWYNKAGEGIVIILKPNIHISPVK